MEILARLLIAAADFFEAEGRTAKIGVVSLVSVLGLMLIAGGLMITGAVLIIWGLFLLLAWALNPAVAGLIVGAVAFILGFAVLMVARQRR